MKTSITIATRPRIMTIPSRLPRPMSTVSVPDIWPIDIDRADKQAAIERQKLEGMPSPAQQSANDRADRHAIMQALREEICIIPETTPPMTEAQIAEIKRRNAWVLARNDKFVAKLEADYVEWEAEYMAELEVKFAAEKANWLAELEADSKSPLKSFRLSLDSSVLTGMSTDPTGSGQKRARLVRPRHFVVSTSNIASSHQSDAGATAVRQYTFSPKRPGLENGLSSSSSQHVLTEHTFANTTSSSSSAEATVDPIAYLVEQATTTRCQLNDLESAIRSMLANPSNGLQTTALTWSTPHKRYELQSGSSAELSVSHPSSQALDANERHDEAYFSARDCPVSETHETELAVDEVEGLQKTLDAGQAWMKVAGEVMKGMKGASGADVDK